MPRLVQAALCVLSPLFLVLVVVRILLFLLAAVLMAVVCSLATMGKRDELPLTGVHGVQSPWLLASQPVRYCPLSQAGRSAHALVGQLWVRPPFEVK